MSFTTSRVGYLLFGSYWNLLPGTYEATVTLSTTVRTDIEVWDATTETLLNRRDAAATDGRTAVQSVFTLTKEGDQTLFSGWGPFSWQPGKPYTRADQTEVRVWTPAPGDVQIYSIEIQPYK